MEKNIDFTPSAPPSYEEAVGSAAHIPRQPVIPPYPVGPSSMPVPARSSEPLPTQPVPVPVPVPVPAPVPQHYIVNPNQMIPQEARVTYQPVIYDLSPNPVKMNCPTCHASIKTTTVQDHKPSAHLCCIVLCLLGCCLCSCLPYCISRFMDVHHFCPKCKNYIGTCKG